MSNDGSGSTSLNISECTYCCLFLKWYLSTYPNLTIPWSVTIKALSISGIFSKYAIEPASKYIFSGTLNHCILTLLFATLFIFIKFTDDTFAVVEFFPNEPHPNVSDGIFVL